MHAFFGHEGLKIHNNVDVVVVAVVVVHWNGNGMRKNPDEIK